MVWIPCGLTLLALLCLLLDPKYIKSGRKYLMTHQSGSAVILPFKQILLLHSAYNLQSASIPTLTSYCVEMDLISYNQINRTSIMIEVGIFSTLRVYVLWYAD
ncbi:hypothetical protein FGO68_gene14893 [Halteria grandinella]|uniref:Uncharacterized protein n=1 Tax=Halteria grandinella TaxID=5974 RepID=A0A8J8NBD4_HALGN|nr:hypothetical protein FGO68_gene14893 [Halteria grandinella]